MGAENAKTEPGSNRKLPYNNICPLSRMQQTNTEAFSQRAKYTEQREIKFKLISGNLKSVKWKLNEEQCKENNLHYHLLPSILAS
jgi:hypothetical protein